MSSALELFLQNSIEMKPDITLRRRYKREVYTQDAKMFKPRQIFEMPAPSPDAEQLITKPQITSPPVTKPKITKPPLNRKCLDL